MNGRVRPVSWIQAARKEFEGFPAAVRDRANAALTIAAAGGKSDIAKPLRGLGSGVLEIGVRYMTDAYRVVYVTEIAGAVWAVHAFRKKSRAGVSTPKSDIDVVRSRIARLKREHRQ